MTLRETMKKLFFLLVFSQLVFFAYGKDENRVFSGTLPDGSVWIGNVRPTEPKVGNITVLPKSNRVTVIDPYPESNFDKVMRRSSPGRVFFDPRLGQIGITGTFSGESNRGGGESKLPESAFEEILPPSLSATWPGEAVGPITVPVDSGKAKTIGKSLPEESPSPEDDIRIIADPALQVEKFNFVISTVNNSLIEMEGMKRSEIRDRIYSVFSRGGKVFSILPQLDKIQIRKVEDVLVRFLRSAGKNDCPESNLQIVTRAFTGG